MYTAHLNDMARNASRDSGYTSAAPLPNRRWRNARTRRNAGYANNAFILVNEPLTDEDFRAPQATLDKLYTEPYRYHVGLGYDHGVQTAHSTNCIGVHSLLPKFQGLPEEYPVEPSDYERKAITPPKLAGDIMECHKMIFQYRAIQDLARDLNPAGPQIQDCEMKIQDLKIEIQDTEQEQLQQQQAAERAAAEKEDQKRARSAAIIEYQRQAVLAAAQHQQRAPAFAQYQQQAPVFRQYQQQAPALGRYQQRAFANGQYQQAPATEQHQIMGPRANHTHGVMMPRMAARNTPPYTQNRNGNGGMEWRRQNNFPGQRRL